MSLCGTALKKCSWSPQQGTRSVKNPPPFGRADNRLLGALPAKVYERLLPHLVRLSFEMGDVMYEPGERLKHVYFPTTCMVSLTYTMSNGASAEMAVVGPEGVVGFAVFMGGGSTSNRAILQSAGDALRMPAVILKEEFGRGDALHQMLLRYAQALITQMSQTAVCNLHHSLEQQMCRWLLLSCERLRSPELLMTQELIASMLGVRRESVSHVAKRLQSVGLIRYEHGHIRILKQRGLETMACECYRVIKDEYERLLGKTER
jgi:CRP-like cAMP-binding protein